MKKLLSIYYCWDEIGNPNSSQNRRQHSVLKNMFDSTVAYRQFTNHRYGQGFLAIKSPDFLIIDRIFLKIFQSLKLIWSLNIMFWGYKFYRNIIKQGNQYDIILLTGTPYMLFSVAKKIAQRVGAKLIVQMYDPLGMNNYVGGSPKLRNRFEKRIVEETDLIIIHSKLMHKMMCERYYAQAHKLKFIPFNSDPDIANIIEGCINQEQGITIVHAGSLQNNRNVNLLIEAMGQISDEIRSQLTVQLIGYVSDSIKEQIKITGFERCFEFISFISKEELYDYYAKADVLLAIDSFKDNVNIFFPSKICEYFSLKKTIFLITPKVSETRRLFENVPELCFGENESDKLKDALENLVYNRSAYENKLDYTQAEQFLPEKTGAQIIKLIDNLF